MEEGYKVIKGENIIVFGEDYRRHPHCLEHLMDNFLTDNKVLWVETIGLRSPKLNLYDIKRSFQIIKKWFGKKPIVERKNPQVISPMTIPFNRISLIRLLNRFMVRRSVNKYLNEYKNPILISSVPQAGNYIGSFKEKIKIFYCVDDFTSWPGHDQKLVKKMEDESIEKSDLIIATSENLVKTRKKKGIETQLLTHGVDINHFALPNKKKINEHPKFYFYGLFDERVDLDLLFNLFSNNPNFELNIVGETRVAAPALEKLKNVFFHGAVDYLDLPKKVEDTDIFLLPYKLNELTKSINPLKLKEYLSTGRPVLATPLPEVLKLKDFLFIGSDFKDFTNLANKLIKEEINYDSKKVLDYLNKKESWVKKAEVLSGLISSNVH